MKIRRLTSADGPAIRRIAASSPDVEDWPAESFGDLPAWVAEDASGVIGFVVTRTAADEIEILNLAVDPARRRRGAGTALLEAAFDYGASSGASRVFLEVRESNRIVRRFYERLGFEAIGRRPRYYRRPSEDALLLRRSLARAR